MAKVLRGQLQIKFRQKHLLTKSAFINYCKDYGVDIDESDLMYYEKDSMLFPAVVVNRGIVRMRKIFMDFTNSGIKEWRYVDKADLSKFNYEQIEPKTYYMEGGIHYGEEGWLDYYLKNKMVHYPSQSRRRRVSKVRKSFETFVLDPKEFGDLSEPFYSKFQMYVVRLVRNRRQLIIKNEGLFRPSEEWVKAAKNIKKYYNNNSLDNYTRRTVSDFYSFFGFYNFIEDLWEQYNSDFRAEIKKVHEFLFGSDEEKDLSIADIEDIRMRLADKYVVMAKQINEGSSYTLDKLNEWRHTILRYGSFSGPDNVSNLRKKYLKQVEDEDLYEVEDPYKVICVLNWFIGLFDGTRLSIKELITGGSKYKYCPYCERAFLPKRITQVSCASEQCKREHENQLKRVGRKTKKYKD